MIININTDLEPTTVRGLEDKERGVIQLLRRCEELTSHKSQMKLREVYADCDMYSTGFFGWLSFAYSNHHGIVIKPTTIWHLVVHNIAEIVSADPDTYRALFTNSDEKQSIVVGQDHAYRISEQSLIAQVADIAPFDIDTLMPKFSIRDEQYNRAISTAVLHTTSGYFDYCMMCCGLRFVDLRGTKQDWAEIVYASVKINEALEAANITDSKLSRYLLSVCTFVSLLIDAWDDPEDSKEFWTNLYTHRNIGSGGELEVNGNINLLYHGVKPKGELNKNFTSGLSYFKYSNISTKEDFIQIAGIVGANMTDSGAIDPQFGAVIVQLRD